MARLQDAHATHYRQPIRLSQAASRAFVNNRQVRLELASEKNGGQLACSESVAGTECGNLIGRCSWMSLDPVCGADQIRSRFACTTFDDFVVDLRGDVNIREEFAQQIKVTHAGQGYERRRIGDNDHSFNRVAVSRSCARSSPE